MTALEKKARDQTVAILVVSVVAVAIIPFAALGLITLTYIHNLINTSNIQDHWAAFYDFIVQSTQYQLWIILASVALMIITASITIKNYGSLQQHIITMHALEKKAYADEALCKS